MELRPYQAAAVDAVLGEWGSGRRRTLLVLPTGTGKTVVFAKVVERVAREGGRSLVLAHRGELLDQAADKIARVTGLACSVERAGQTSVGTWERVTVGSVQTLMREERLATLDTSRFDAIVVDEAHHALSDSYRRVLDHFDANVLGVTATPDRADRRELGEVFDSLAYEYGLASAVRDGWLCPIEAQTIPLRIDISGVAIQSGDYAAGQLGNALDPYLGAIADAMVGAGCASMRTVVFLPLVRTAKAFAEVLRARGLSACEVDGQSDDRAEVLADFQAGRYQVMCNSMLLTEGWDCPAVDCVVVLRPTKSRPLYCQMVGRGTRLSPETGKQRLLLLDFLWMTGRHQLCRPAHLVARDADVAQRMAERLAGDGDDPGGPADLMELEEASAADVQTRREEAVAAELARLRHRKARLVDPLLYEMSIADADLTGYVPEFAWQAAPVSERQAAALERWGVDPDGVQDAGKASLLLDRLSARRDAGLATPKQVRQLEQRGFRHPGTWTFEQASEMMGRLAANGWRTPRGMNPATYDPREEVA